MNSIEKYCVVIPNWNGLDFLADCLDSLTRQTQAHHTIVVDNGSSDGSCELVETRYPNVQLVALDRNYGFAGGVNRGIEAALGQQAEFIALLNNDAVADPNWLHHLVQTAVADPKLGVVTSKILQQGPGRIDSTGDFYSSWGLPFPRGRDEVDRGQYDEPGQRTVFAGSGGASLYRTEMLRQVGLFDEDFFAYYEDVDLSFRARLAGWGVRYEPAAIVHHHVGGTSSKLGHFARYHSVKNFSLLYLKNMPGILYWKYMPKFCLAAILLGLNDIRRGQFGTFVRATFKSLTLTPTTWSKRRTIQKGRTVSPAAIDALLYHRLPPNHRRRWLGPAKDRGAS